MRQGIGWLVSGLLGLAPLLPAAGQHVLADAVELAVNGGFEADAPDAWAPDNAGQATVTMRLVEGGAHGGQRFARTTSDYAEQRPWFPWRQVVQGIQGGAKYRASAWVRTADIQYATSYAVHWGAPGRGTVRMDHVDVPMQAATWTHISGVLTAPDDATTVNLLLSMHGRGRFDIDDVSFERVLDPWTESWATARVYPVAPGTAGWADVPISSVMEAATVSDAEQQVGVDQTPWTGPDDLSFDLQATRDQAALHLRIVVRDDARQPRNPYWRGDSLQLAFDPDFDRAEVLADDDLSLGIDLGGQAPSVVVERTPDGRQVKPGDVALTVTPSAGGYTVELAVPWTALGRAPDDPRPLGFTVVANDDDGHGRKWAEWTPGIARSKSPAQYGILLPTGADHAGLVLLSPAGAQPDTRPVFVEALLLGDRPAQTSLALTVDGQPAGARDVATQPGVTHLPLALRSELLTPGYLTLAADSEGRSSQATVELAPIRHTVQEALGRLAALQPSIATLRAKVEDGRRRKLDVDAPGVTLATAERFQIWIPADASREGGAAMALREVTRLEPLVTNALAEVEEVLASPAAHPAIVPPDVSQAVLRDGGWYVGDRPVFFLGYCSMDRELVALLPEFGCNLVGLSAAARWLYRDGPEPDPAALQQIADQLDEAARLGLRADILFGQALPDWLLKTDPTLTAATGHFCDYDIDHPVARKQITDALTAVAEVAGRHPSILSYDLWNEAGYWQMSSRGRESFREAMQARYGDIPTLNQSWGTNYTGFAGLKPVDRDPDQPAAYADWVRWNDARVTNWFAAMRDAVRRGDPTAQTHVKVGNEIVFQGSIILAGKPQTSSRHNQGLDRFALAQLCEIHGCDTRPTMLSDEYAYAWQLTALSYDAQRSMAPDKPIFDSEWHGVQTVYYDNPDIPAEHLDASLWLSYLHGLDANLLWWWSRNGSTPKAQWFEGSMSVQPQLMDIFGRNNLTVQRLAPEITAFTDQRPQVWLFYSKPSAILDLAHLDALNAVYETLSWLGLPIGIATEEMVLDGRLRVGDVLIVPDAQYVTAARAEALIAALQTQVRTIPVGRGAFSLDEHAKLRGQSLDIPAITLSEAGDAAAWEARLQAAGVARPLVVRGPDGQGSKPILALAAVRNGRRLVWLQNVGREPALAEATLDSQPVRGLDLIHGERWDSPTSLAPWATRLIECDAR